MNALNFLFIIAGIIYGVFVDGTFWKIYLALVAGYTVVMIAYRNQKDNTKRRNILISSWSESNDPTSYVCNELIMDKTVAYVKKINEEQKDVRVTINHVFGHALAWGIFKQRSGFGRIALGSFKRSKDLGITILVDVEGGKDLVPVTIWNAHLMTLLQFAQKCNEKVGRAKKSEDRTHQKATQMAHFMPSFIQQPLALCGTYVAANLGISLPFMGIKKEQFGHAMLTNIGPLNLRQGFAPLCPPIRAVLLMCVGKIMDRPAVAEDGKTIIVRKECSMVITGDHRFADAAGYLQFYRCFDGYVNDPEHFDHSLYEEKKPWDEKEDPLALLQQPKLKA